MLEQRGKWNEHTGDLLDRKNGFDVIACEICGFKHIIPVPTEEELIDVYRHEYYVTEKPAYVERTKEDLDWWNAIYQEHYDLFEKYLNEERRTLLEVGSGLGFFLKYGQERGWRVLGVEPSRKAAAHCREMGLEVVEKFLTEENVDSLGQYDVVHLFNVLEHLPNPLGFMKMVKRLVKKGGLLSVSVPNDYNPLQSAIKNNLGYQPWWVAPPHHINYFCQTSLENVFRENGIEPVFSGTSFPLEFFILMGMDYVGDERTGRKCHEMRKLFELNMDKAGLAEVKKKIYASFNKLGLGRELTVIGVVEHN